ncbi:MAG: hypothetical protein ACLTBV_05100 [Enterocloster bolteae]
MLTRKQSACAGLKAADYIGKLAKDDRSLMEIETYETEISEGGT